ncbi:hypothetical protein [Acidipropionibacterium virtanenii]|uniref:Uncharacterized protein n=1 Tax=Acidipropionibacterium virtanenii TaxID=2057246 RepID=A0A344UVM6_9ACTN|nr:hypothetical protein [Acidipropionibacterium virtanenii]AXE39324.1 hypothetical protein JS278_02172 [Acidipropionibacterium virtanenii]
MSQQPPPWGPQQYPQQGPAGETPAGVPAPPPQSQAPQNQGWQQYPGQQPYGQSPAPQLPPQAPAVQPPVPQVGVPGSAPAAPVGSPASWLRRYPRLLMLCGTVLSLFMMVAPWGRSTYSLSSSQVTTSAHGLAWIASTTGAQSAVSAGAWNSRVVLTLIVLVALVAVGSIGLALDRLLPSWWDLSCLVASGLLGVLMLWGVIQTVRFTSRQNDYDSIEASTAAGVWLFLVTVLVTVGGAVWQFILDRRAAAPTGPAQLWAGAPGYQQGPVPQQPGYQQGPAPQQWNQPGAPQQGWNGNQWGQ